MCIALKGYIANDNIIVTDDDTVGEFEVFSKIGNSWKASRDHDDLAMSVVDVTAIFDHPYFEVMMEEILGLAENADFYKMYDEKMDEQFDNLYENYKNMNMYQPIYNNGFGGYFGNKGLYQ